MPTKESIYRFGQTYGNLLSTLAQVFKQARFKQEAQDQMLRAQMELPGIRGQVRNPNNPNMPYVGFDQNYNPDPQARQIMALSQMGDNPFAQSIMQSMAAARQATQQQYVNVPPGAARIPSDTAFYNPPVPRQTADKNAQLVPTGNTKTEGGKIFEEVIASDPTNMQPLPDAKPIWKYKTQESVAQTQLTTPVDDKLAQKIANYEADVSKVTSLRGMRRELYAKRAAELNPAFDMTQYPARLKLRSDFTSGKAAANIRSLNTLAQHADKLQEVGEALENGDVQVVNTVVNWISRATGDRKVIDFDTAANAVANEAVTVFKNTGATDQEIAHVRDVINSSASPEQIRAYIETLLNLVNGRIAALKSQYEQGMGMPADFQMLDKNTVDVLNKYNIQPSDIGGGAPLPGQGPTMDKDLRGLFE